MADYVQLKNISPKAWEHPADRAALSALQKVPGLDELIKKFLGLTQEKSLRLLFLASSVRVNNNQFPRINALLEKACFTLDVITPPELYIAQNPILNAGAVGVDKNFIVLNSSILDTMSDDEILCIIGHEIGHCLSGHVLYKTLLAFLLNFSLALLNLPIPTLVLYGIIAALREWDRKSEFSADRAGLLVCQKPETSYHVLMKLAGGSKVAEMNIDEFFKQAKEYEAGGDILDSVFKILNLLQQTHPFPVLRLTELKTWKDSGKYDAIIGGDYVKRGDKEDVIKDFKEAADQYQDDMKRSQDPLAQGLANLGKEFEKATKDIDQFFRNMFGPKPPADTAEKPPEAPPQA